MKRDTNYENGESPQEEAMINYRVMGSGRNAPFYEQSSAGIYTTQYNSSNVMLSNAGCLVALNVTSLRF